MIALVLSLVVGLPVARAQIQVEGLFMGGCPFMLSGRNMLGYATLGGRLQFMYHSESLFWQPYLAVSLNAMRLPVHNKEIESLAMPVWHTSLAAGINRDILKTEENRNEWSVGGGVGICMLRPKGETLLIEGRESSLGYDTHINQAWFPEIELNIKWLTYVYEGSRSSSYMGLQLNTAALWLSDNRERFTTYLSGTEYSLNFNDFAIWPSICAVVGFRF
ncbi:hypothetical protein [Taibaiella koreensis]|uniref:hypothetical protein n=1 Tax=Taibaiella koreensis TaxID=1268548 RepID=UPI0013C2A961|nr:hypothetical protein [Taibaiella koreensis]